MYILSSIYLLNQLGIAARYHQLFQLQMPMQHPQCRQEGLCPGRVVWWAARAVCSKTNGRAELNTLSPVV